MLYVTLDSNYQVIIKGSINGKKVSPFVYGKLDFDEGGGYVFTPSDSGYSWECGTADEEAALIMITLSIYLSVRHRGRRSGTSRNRK